MFCCGIHPFTLVAEDGSRIWRPDILVFRSVFSRETLANGFPGLKYVVVQMAGTTK